MSREVWILAEQKRGNLEKITFELISGGCRITENLGVNLTAVLLGNKIEKTAKELAQKGVDRVLMADDPSLEYFNVDIYSKILKNAVKRFQPRLILIGHTFTGIDIAATLAAKLNVGLVSNCIKLRVENNELIFVASMYNDKIHADVILERSEPMIATVQSGAIPIVKIKPKDGEIVKLDLQQQDLDVRSKVLEIPEIEVGEIDITKADVIVAIGRGIGKTNNFRMLENLAKVMGATLACSRPIVDMGLLPYSRQVGTSGKSVRPKLYIACGISGQSQHTAGRARLKPLSLE